MRHGTSVSTFSRPRDFAISKEVWIAAGTARLGFNGIITLAGTGCNARVLDLTSSTLFISHIFDDAHEGTCLACCSVVGRCPDPDVSGSIGHPGQSLLWMYAILLTRL